MDNYETTGLTFEVRVGGMLALHVLQHGRLSPLPTYSFLNPIASTVEEAMPILH